MTAPEGYLLQLSGNITMETYDKLSVYDNSEASGTKLLDAVSHSDYDHTHTTPVSTVTSSGQSMTLYFELDGGISYAGLDLTVTVVPITYTITYNLASGSVATENPATYTIESAAITLNNPTREGYDFVGWTGTGLTDATTTVTIAHGSTGDRSYTATWTASAVTITNGAGSVITDEDEITVPSLDYTRDFATPGATPDATVDGVAVDVYTLCLPYAPATGEGIKYYTLSGATTTALQFEEITGSPAADTPYLVTVSAATSVGLTTPMTDVTLKKEVDNSVTAGDFKFVGTTIGLTNAEATAKCAYILKSGNQWGPVMPATVEHPEYGNAYIPPFRAFIVAADSAPLLNTDFGSTTGIQSLQLIDQDGTEHWYDLNGRKFSQKPTQKGVYIHKGRKEVVR